MAPDEFAFVAPRQQETPEEQFQHLMEELDILTVVLEDIEDGEIADRITMWIDWMIYRALYETDPQPDFSAEGRECRKLLLEHLDDMAWGAGAAAGLVTTAAD